MWRCAVRGGAPVAVKIQYPGAGDALLADLKQLSRLGGMFKVIQPGLDIKPLLAELRDRITEELDYELEAASQRAFADAYKGDDEILVPDVLAASPRVLVTEWIDGHAAGEDHRVRHRVRIGTAPATCSRRCTSPRRRGRGCCTPTRTRATSACCPTAGSA